MEIREIAEKTLALLEGYELSSREISERLNFAESKIIKVIRLLIDAEKIKLNPRNQYYRN